MRTKYIVLVLSTILFVILGVLLLLPGKKIKIEGIKEMTYDYVNENNIGVEYFIKCDDSCTAKITKYGVSDSNEIKLKLKEDTLLEIEDLLNKYDVVSWHNYDKIDEKEEKGESFNIEIYMKNGHNVSSYGVFSLPNNFYNVKNELDNIFLNIESENTTEINKVNKIDIIINNKNYELNLEDNNTTKELLKLLPLKMKMDDLNNNEKYVYLDKSLPTDRYNPKNIKKGDVMLFGNNCLVIFYKSFKTNYTYTKIGHIDNLDDIDGNSVVVQINR